MADRRAALAVALAAATASVPVGAALADDFVCRGRDPSAWELAGRGGGQATLQPERGARRNLNGTASNLPAEGVVVWRGRSGDGQPDVVAVMLKGACTDPGAGEVSGYLGIVSVPGAGPSVGCCSYGGKSPAPAPAVAALPSPAAPAGAVAGAAAAAASPGRPELAKPDAARPPVAAAKPAAEPPPAPVKAAARSRPSPSALGPGVVAKVAGSARVNLRAKPSDGARVVGKVKGGQGVLIEEVARQGGRVWYRVAGRGVPASAWIRGDMLAAPAAASATEEEDDARPVKAPGARGRPAAGARRG